MGTNIDPGHLNPHLLGQASLDDAVGFMVLLELGFQHLHLMLGKPGLCLCHVFVGVGEHQGRVMLLGEEGVAVCGYKVRMRPCCVPCWVSWVHMGLTLLSVLHVHVRMMLMMLMVYLMLMLLMLSLLFLFLCLLGAERQRVLHVVELPVVEHFLNRLIPRVIRTWRHIFRYMIHIGHPNPATDQLSS